MARTIQQIKQAMIDEKAAQTALSGLTSTSQTAKWNLYFYIVAAAIAIFEQLQGLFKSDLEAIAAAAPPNTAQWTKAKVLDFETGNVAELNTTTFVVEYPTPVAANRILTRCSVTTGNYNNVLIKIAKGTPPTPISVGEETELDDYINTWIPVGIDYSIVNEDSDKLMVDAVVYYQGQYANTISTAVEQALNDYLTNLPFDGVISNQAIIDSIQAVSGVNYVRLNEVLLRRDTQAYGAGTILYNLSSSVDSVSAATFAGYAEEETTAGHTFADSLTYVAQ
jgi:hypothetical protein